MRAMAGLPTPALAPYVYAVIGYWAVLHLTRGVRAAMFMPNDEHGYSCEYMRVETRTWFALPTDPQAIPVPAGVHVGQANVPLEHLHLQRRPGRTSSALVVMATILLVRAVFKISFSFMQVYQNPWLMR